LVPGPNVKGCPKIIWVIFCHVLHLFCFADQKNVSILLSYVLLRTYDSAFKRWFLKMLLLFSLVCFSRYLRSVTKVRLWILMPMSIHINLYNNCHLCQCTTMIWRTLHYLFLNIILKLTGSSDFVSGNCSSGFIWVGNL
jgi:hypothetical protein